MDGSPLQSILVVDDEPTIVDVVSRYLDREGYAIRSAANGRHAVELINSDKPDLVVLEVNLPGLGGLEVMAQIEQRERTAVILLSASAEPRDRVAGLELGADDYVAKPFVPAELVARVGAVLRRASRGHSNSAIAFDGLEIDPAARNVFAHGQEVDLTPIEFDLLAFLASHPGQVFSRRQLLEAVWPYEFYTESSTVTVHVRRLRRKIEDDPANPCRVTTVRGAGYRFDP